MRMTLFRLSSCGSAARFLVGGFLALALQFATASTSGNTRLHEIGVTRFVLRNGEEWSEHGLLDAHGSFHKNDERRVLSIVTVPPEVRGRLVITLDAWGAYQRLGPDALRYFSADTEGTQYSLGNRFYIDVAANPQAQPRDGLLINLSTRGRASTTEKLIGGFVVDQQSRRVLVRAVGPALSAFGVNDRMNDPRVTIYRGDVALFANGDWGSPAQGGGNVADIMALAGAFPLPLGSKDAALVVELPPGNYTAQAEPESGEAGVVLLEIYRLP